MRGWCGVVGEAGCVDMVLWGGVWCGVGAWSGVEWRRLLVLVLVERWMVGIEWKGGWMDGGWKGMEARTKP